MCIDKDFTKSLLKNMIRTLEVAHETYASNAKVCLNECEEFFLSYELLVQHMKGIYITGDEGRDPARDYDALVHSV